MTSVLGRKFDTTGVLGVSQGPDGLAARGFPSWATIPAVQDLATGRRWHFLFAWILVINAVVYLIYGIASGHIMRDLVPRLREWKTIPHDIVAHLKLQFSHGSDAPQYNVLQKISYAGILFVVLPVLVLAGLEMSPGVDAALPWLRDIFGGRQSARDRSFPHGLDARPVRRRPRRDGDRLRPLQQHALDDHRPLRRDRGCPS